MPAESERVAAASSRRSSKALRLEAAAAPPVALPITGELDLHTFRPQDLGELLPAYFAECAARRIREVRVIHGKGTGTLRTTVHALLRRLPAVESFRSGDETSGSWGATLVTLKR